VGDDPIAAATPLDRRGAIRRSAKASPAAAIGRSE
jgi:hypothetical protein